MLPVKRQSTYLDSNPGKRRRRSESISSSEDDSTSDSSVSPPGPSTDRNASKAISSSRIAKELDIEEEDPDESDDEDDAEDNSKPSSSVKLPSASRLGLKPKGTSSNPIKPVKDPSAEATSRIPPSRKPNITDFSALGLSAPLVSALGAMSIRRPTPVQAACIPELLAGKDCVGNAKTGQGKTVAFALPILQQLAKDPFGIFALVLTPTRELAFQIAAQFNVIGAPLDISTTVVVGGMDMMSQMVSLNKRPHVVVATPGRLVDLLNESSGEWSLSRIKFLVLDEADRLLGTGFASELATIFSHVPADRQTCLFTATLTPTIEALALTPPRPGKSKPYVYRDSDTSEIETVETLKQQYILCPSHVREVYLYHLLCNPPESILHLRRGSAEAERRKANLAKKEAKERRQNKYQIGLVSRKKK
ncbi:putative RNA helicase, partial [Tulasnella sp. 427]